MDLLSPPCRGGWLDAARAGGQLNGPRQGVTAGLKTGPAVSTFPERIGHVNGYESTRQKWLRRERGEKRLRLKAPDGEVPFPTPGLLSQVGFLVGIFGLAKLNCNSMLL